jgi:hypothetical protein
MRIVSAPASGYERGHGMTRPFPRLTLRRISSQIDIPKENGPPERVRGNERIFTVSSLYYIAQ